MEPKFNLDRPGVSDEEIEKHKDFDKLVKQFKEQSIQKARSDVNFLKNKKVTYAAVIAGVTVLCTLTYLTVFKNKTATSTTAHDKITTTEQTSATTPGTRQAAFIAPPSSKISIPYSTYKVDAARGGELAHHTKSKIKIPKNAFVNKKGEDVIGDVQIEYREFHDQAEIIASGIPMTYDSAGTQYHFESAGMFDVRGTQNGEPVFIKPGKTLSVEMASGQPADHFNQYELDTVARNWNCLRRDTPERMKGEKSAGPAKPVEDAKVENSVTKNLQQQIDAIPPKIESEKVVYQKKVEQLSAGIKKPVKPAQANSGRPQFELDVDYKEFPELAAYKNAVFEVGDENTNYKKEFSQITWSEARISEGPDKGKNYLLTLKLRNRVEKLVVYPALSGADYDNALKSYEKKFAEYNKGLDKRQAEEKKLHEELEAKQAAYLAEQKKLSADLLKEQIRIRRQMEEQLAKQFESADAQQKVMRIFAVARFGIYNSDCPRSLPSGPPLNAVFAHEGGSVLPNNVYLIEAGRNIVYNYAGSMIKAMRYDPSKEYSLCVVSGGSLYYCSKDEFKQSLASKNNTFRLSAMPDNVDNVGDFRKTIGI